MDIWAVPFRKRKRSTRKRAASISAVIGTLLLMLVAAGCNEGPRIVGAQREFDEQVERARENARERQAAHRHALRVEQTMDAHLRAAAHPTADCQVEYAPVRARQGIVPIACGNLLGSWPLTVKFGYLRCEPSISKNFSRVIFTAPNGSEYAVNSSAHGTGYLGIDMIWKRDSAGKKADIEPLRKKGLELCGRSGNSPHP